MAGSRKERVGDLLHQFLGEEVRKLRDPRLQLVTITSVKVSADGKVARVFWSALSSAYAEAEDDAIAQSSEFSAEEQRETVRALEKAGGYLKKRISESLDLRFVPELRFEFDETARSGSRIDYLLAKAQLGKE